MLIPPILSIQRICTVIFSVYKCGVILSSFSPPYQIPLGFNLNGFQIWQWKQHLTPFTLLWSPCLAAERLRTSRYVKIKRNILHQLPTCIEATWWSLCKIIWLNIRHPVARKTIFAAEQCFVFCTKLQNSSLK